MCCTPPYPTTNSDVPTPTLEYHSNAVRMHQTRHSNARKRNSNAFECTKTETRMPENEIRMHSKTRKPIPRYRKTNIRIYIFGFCFIVFGPNVMVYELYVGHPPCGISVHPVSISAGPTWHPAVSSNSMDGSIYYPDCMLPMLTGAMACSLVYIHTT